VKGEGVRIICLGTLVDDIVDEKIRDTLCPRLRLLLYFGFGNSVSRFYSFEKHFIIPKVSDRPQLET